MRLAVRPRTEKVLRILENLSHLKHSSNSSSNSRSRGYVRKARPWLNAIRNVAIEARMDPPTFGAILSSCTWTSAILGRKATDWPTIWTLKDKHLVMNQYIETFKGQELARTQDQHRSIQSKPLRLLRQQVFHNSICLCSADFSSRSGN